MADQNEITMRVAGRNSKPITVRADEDILGLAGSLQLARNAWRDTIANDPAAAAKIKEQARTVFLMITDGLADKTLNTCGVLNGFTGALLWFTKQSAEQGFIEDEEPAGRYLQCTARPDTISEPHPRKARKPTPVAG